MEEILEEIRTDSEAATEAWARDFAARLKPGDIVALAGDLGAGKTVVCRGIAAGLGCEGDVHSPSYALVHEYAGGRLPVFHMDLYRLAPGADWDEIGLDHYFRQGGVCLIEWAERLPPGAPCTWRIALAADGESGRILRVGRS
jgi:tRNA threonylcarbamoyladenosine biosynthesis protein TsaE